MEKSMSILNYDLELFPSLSRICLCLSVYMFVCLCLIIRIANNYIV